MHFAGLFRDLVAINSFRQAGAVTFVQRSWLHEFIFFGNSAFMMELRALSAPVPVIIAGDIGMEIHATPHSRTHIPKSRMAANGVCWIS